MLNLVLSSKLDVPRTSELHQKILDESSGERELVVDCSKLEAICAAAAQLIVSASKSSTDGGLKIALSSPPAWLCSDFELLGLTEILKRISPHE